MHGKRKLRRTAPTSAKVGLSSPASKRLTNAFHCTFFWVSSRKPSVSAKGMSSGSDVPRRLNENSIAFLHGLHIELPGVCHKPNIVKVLHAAVADVEHNHCMEFLSDRGFTRVRADQRRF